MHAEFLQDENDSVWLSYCKNIVVKELLETKITCVKKDCTVVNREIDEIGALLETPWM